jgi:hypothetical protein
MSNNGIVTVKVYEAAWQRRAPADNLTKRMDHETA